MSTNKDPMEIEDKVLDYYNYYDKACCVQRIENDILKKTLRFFKYGGLPESMPERNIELILQKDAFGIVPTEGDIVLLRGGFAPPHNVYNENTKIIVNNPYGLIVPGKPAPKDGADTYLQKTFTIGEDCILVRNDPLYEGMLPFIHKYGVFITEAELTLMNILFASRAQYAIIADDDKGYESALEWIDGLRRGKLGAIHSKSFNEDIGTNTQPYGGLSSGTITQMVELIQYFDAKMNNGIGLDMNFNMKRERLNDGEVDLNTNSVRTVLNTFLEERQEAFNKVNEVRGTNITVELRKEETKELMGNQYQGVDIEGDEVVDETNEEPITEEIADKVLDKLIEKLENTTEEEESLDDDTEPTVSDDKDTSEEGEKEKDEEDDKRDNA